MSAEEKWRFAEDIRTKLAEHPDWLDVAISAVCSGMSTALVLANNRAAEADLAWRMALSLVTPDRLTASAKEHINSILVRHLKTVGAHSPVEKEALEQFS